MTRIVRYSILMCSTLLLVSCAASRKGHEQQAIGDYCQPALQYQYHADWVAMPDDALQRLLQTDTSLTNRLSQHDWLLANGLGMVPLLRTVIRESRSSGGSLSYVANRQQVQHRLQLAATEIASVAAELDCEGERADQLATYMDQKDTRRIRSLTLLSVIIGAATTVVSSLAKSSDVSQTVGIGGGLIGAGFGGLAAFSSNKSVQFTHKRNLLADIWYQPRQSSVYSPFVWYVLNEKSFSNSGQNSISYNTRQRWQGYVLVGSSQEQQDIYFGTGGDYDADDLHTRANMLHQPGSA